MKTLRGTIDCEATKAIPEGSTATVSIIDCCLADARSKTISEVQIPNVSSFPFQYEIEYDESQIIMNIAYGFRVAANVTKNDRLEFINDTAHLIIVDDQLADNVDVKVIQVQHYD
jgi:uncharacterized lipoprotein YbaY